MQLPIRAICVFHAAAKAGSISRAAVELSVTPSAVSQQIQLLEEQLGTSLMVRTGRRVTLTETGERYFASISDQIERITEATSQIRGVRSVMALNVRATPTLSNKWLLPRLASVVDRYPDLELRLDGTSQPTDFEREIVDVEIRHGDGRWPGLFVEPLAEEAFWPVCAPSYAASASLQASDLLDHRLIHSVKSQVQWTRWFGIAGIEPHGRWRKVLFDRSHMAIDAAVGGLGIALESTLMIERELARGTLILPLREAPTILLVTQWVVCPNSHLRKRQVRLFLDWLRRERNDWQARQDNTHAGRPIAEGRRTTVPSAAPPPHAERRSHHRSTA